MSRFHSFLNNLLKSAYFFSLFASASSLFLFSSASCFIFLSFSLLALSSLSRRFFFSFSFSLARSSSLAFSLSFLRSRSFSLAFSFSRARAFSFSWALSSFSLWSSSSELMTKNFHYIQEEKMRRKKNSKAHTFIKNSKITKNLAKICIRETVSCLDAFFPFYTFYYSKFVYTI